MKKRSKINTGRFKIGTFTKAAKKAGMPIQEFAKKVLSNKQDYSSAMIKKASSTINATKLEKKKGGLVKYQKGKLINVPPGAFSKNKDQKSVVPSWVNWDVPSKPGNYKRNFPDKSGYLLPSISTLTLDPNWKNNLIPSIVQRPKRVHPKLKGRDNPSKLANLQLKPKKSLPTKFNPKFKLNTPKDKVNHPIFGKYKKVSKPSGFDASFDYNPNSALSFTGKINPELKNKDSDPTIQIGGKYKNILDFGFNTDFKGSNLNLGLNNKYVGAKFNTDFEGVNKLALKAKYKELFGADFDTNFKENYNIGVKAGPFSGRFSNTDNIKNLDLSLKHKNIGLKVNTDLQGKEKFNISSEKEIGPVKVAANYNINRNKDKLSHDLGFKGDIKVNKKVSLSPSLVSDITNQKNKFGLSAKISPNKNITFTPKVSWSPDQYSIGTGINWKPNKMLNIGADINYGNEGLAGNVSLKAALNNAKAKPADLFNNKRKGGLVEYQEGETIQSKTNTLIEGNPLFNKYIPNPIVKEVNTESPYGGMVGYIPAGERDPQGNIINPSNRPLIELYKGTKNLSNDEKLNMIKGDLLHALDEDPKWKTLVDQVWENRDDTQKRVDKNAYDGRNGIYAKDERGNLIEDEEGRLTKIGEKSSDDPGYDNRPFDKWANVSRKDALVRGFIMKYPNMKNVYNKKQLEILNSMEGYLNNQNPNFHHLGNTTTYKGDSKRTGGLVKYQTGKYIPVDYSGFESIDSPVSESTSVEPIAIPTTADINSYADFNISKRFHKDWMSSPMHKQMLKKSAPDNYLKILKTRSQNIKNATLQNRFIKGDQRIPGSLFSGNPSGGYAQGLNYVNQSPLNSSIERRNMPYMRQYNQYYSSLPTHELSHIEDYDPNIPKSLINKFITPIDKYDYNYRNFPKSDVSFIRNLKIKDNKLTKESEEYYSDPTEVRARLSEIRHSAIRNKTWDPFNEKMTPKNLKWLNLDIMKPRALGDLQQIYSDEQIIDLLNTVSQRDDGSNIQTAQKGGQVKKDLKGTYTSSAQRLMDDNDLDPSYITASNENGRIYKGDVSKALKSLNNYGAGFPNALDYKKVGVLPKNKIKYSKNTLIGPVGMPPYRWKSYKTPLFNDGGELPDRGLNTVNPLDRKGRPRAKERGDYKFPKEAKTNKQQSFVLKWYPIVQKAIKKSGYNIDPKAVVTQLGLESNWGKSGLTSKYNNFGGYSATSNDYKTGNYVSLETNEYLTDSETKKYKNSVGRKLVRKTEDSRINKKGEVENRWRVKKGFKKFATPEEGISKQIKLISADRYAKQGTIDSLGDQSKYFNAIKAGGYATDPDYVKHNLATYESIKDYFPEEKPKVVIPEVNYPKMPYQIEALNTATQQIQVPTQQIPTRQIQMPALYNKYSQANTVLLRGGQIPHQGTKVSMKMLDENDMLPPNDSDRLSYRNKPVGMSLTMSKTIKSPMQVIQYDDGGNIARTEDEFEEGLNAGKNVFPFGQKGLKKMTSTPPSGDMEVPINMKGFTDGEQTDEQVMLPGEDVNIDGDTVVETPDLSSMDLNKAFDYANSKKFPIFMWKGNEYKLKRHLKKKQRGGLFSNKVTDHVKLNPGFSPDVK